MIGSASVSRTRNDVPFAIVVDDDREMAEEVREALILPQEAVLLAESLADAMTKIDDNPTIELIITDYYLAADKGHRMNGEQLIDCVAYRHPQRNFEYIVMSGDPYCLHNLRERETVICHAKPLIPRILVETLIGKQIPIRYAESVSRERKRELMQNRGGVDVI